MYMYVWLARLLFDDVIYPEVYCALGKLIFLYFQFPVLYDILVDGWFGLHCIHVGEIYVCTIYYMYM